MSLGMGFLEYVVSRNHGVWTYQHIGISETCNVTRPFPVSKSRPSRFVVVVQAWRSYKETKWRLFIGWFMLDPWGWTSSQTSDVGHLCNEEPENLKHPQTFTPKHIHTEHKLNWGTLNLQNVLENKGPGDICRRGTNRQREDFCHASVTQARPQQETSPTALKTAPGLVNVVTWISATL